MPGLKTSPSLIKTLYSILKMLPPERRRHFFLLSLCMLFSAGFETLSLGCIAFFASAVANPSAVLKSRYIIKAQTFLNFEFLTHTSGLIVSLSILVVSLVITKNFILPVILFVGNRFAAFVDGYFGEMLMGKILSRPYEWHLYQNSADLVLAIDWRRYFGVHFLYPILQMLSDIFIVALMLGMLLIAEPVISICSVVILGCTGLMIMMGVKKTLDHNTQLVRDFQQEVNRQVTKSIHGVKEVKIFGKQSFFISELQKIVYKLAIREAFKQFFTRSPAWILESIGFVLITSTICVMMFLMESSSIKITGTIALIAVTAWRILPAMNRILNSITALRTALPYVHNAFKYIDTQNDSTNFDENDINNPKYDFKFEREFVFDNISFTYNRNNEPALKNIKFKILKGQTIGIIGPSGAGKSTLIDILTGLLPPTEGQVVIDGIRLNQHIIPVWMKSIGYVAQAPYIYDGTLAENIAFGIHTDDIDRSRVHRCCDMAAMDFLEDLPHGIDTAVGERGLRMSGGQRQRVAIARALYHQPQLMVFDEATSSLDAKNEEAIQKTVYSLRGQLTLVIIAHRLTTVKDCDRIYCIDKGDMIRSGTPSEILPWYENYIYRKEQ